MCFRTLMYLGFSEFMAVGRPYGNHHACVLRALLANVAQVEYINIMLEIMCIKADV